MERIEEWRDIKGYEGHYQVSNIGRIKSIARIVESRKGVFLNKKERILIPFKNQDGYLKYKLSKNGVEKSFASHRLVAAEFIDNPFYKPQVNHINGIKDDNWVGNLEWVTSSENVVHSLKNNLKIPQKGSEHGMSKLTEIQVLEIRRIGRTKTLKEIAKIYNVDSTLISLILLNKIWNHV
jgi:hypothetical protein